MELVQRTSDVLTLEQGQRARDRDQRRESALRRSPPEPFSIAAVDLEAWEPAELGPSPKRSARVPPAPVEDDQRLGRIREIDRRTSVARIAQEEERALLFDRDRLETRTSRRAVLDDARLRQRERGQPPGVRGPPSFFEVPDDRDARACLDARDACAKAVASSEEAPRAMTRQIARRSGSQVDPTTARGRRRSSGRAPGPRARGSSTSPRRSLGIDPRRP
jgi:hypothetical protein